jgi:hypothetical protein
MCALRFPLVSDAELGECLRLALAASPLAPPPEPHPSSAGRRNRSIAAHWRCRPPGAGARVTLDPADGHTPVASAAPSGGATSATPGTHSVGVSVRDSSGATASDAGNVTFSLLDPTAQLLPRDGRPLAAAVAAPGSTIASCVIGVRSGAELAYTALPTTYDSGRCAAELDAADSAPGDDDVRVVATGADGATGTDTAHITIPGPVVELPQPAGSIVNPATRSTRP